MHESFAGLPGPLAVDPRVARGYRMSPRIGISYLGETRRAHLYTNTVYTNTVRECARRHRIILSSYNMAETKNEKKTSGTEKGTDIGSDQVEQTGQANGRHVDIPDDLDFDSSVKTYQSGDYTHEDLGLSEDQVLAMYRDMLLQRRFEERAAQMYGRQKIAGFLHLYIGQEAVSTGSVGAIEVGRDSVITAYRDHGLGLALGMTPEECMAELFGKVGGSSGGKGGSMHFFKKELNFYGGHGIVGGHIAVGVGIAFAHKYTDDGGCCLIFLGDGAVGQGSFHESANLASLYGVPAVLIIENNQYAMGTSTQRAFAQPDFHRYGVSYNMPAAVANGMDVFSVLKAVSEHAEMAREGRPSLLEIRTYRYRGHSMSDPANYRTKDELDRRKEEDPIILLKSYMLENEMSTNEDLDVVDDEVKQVVLASVEFSEKSELPPIESIYEDVYEQRDYPFLTNGHTDRKPD